jgi:RHO1 GDP-GTP exchange protein 1/2
MDKPFGPRPPDKRNTAYEDIFGKPSVIHHLSTAPNIHPQHQGPYYYPRQPLHQNNIDRAATLYSAQHPQRQSFIPSQSPSQPLAPLPPQVYSASQSQSLTPPSIHSRARSDASSGRSIGDTQPQLADPIDTTFQALTRSGLTPAQAYQAQIYLSSPAGQHSERIQPRRESAPAYSSPVTQSAYQPDNGAPVRTASGGMPRLAIHVDDDDGKVLNPEDSPSEDGSDGGPSELPWARLRAFATPKPPFGKRRSDLDVTATLVSAPQQPPPQVVAPRPVSQSTAPAASNRPNTLTLDTGLSPASPNPSVLSTSPNSSTSTTLVHTSSSLYSARRSSDSSRTMPRPPNGTRRERTVADRSMSMSAATAGARTALLGFVGYSRPPLPGMGGSGRTSPTALRFAHARSRTPVVYPALLSRVAAAFRERVQLSDHVKDGLTYTDCFDGREAVDKITYIIKTADRNLALLLGRALDAQKFFHDVTYDHRLRDSPSELYQFPMGVASPFVSGELANGPAKDGQEIPPKPPSKHESSADSTIRISPAPSARNRSAEWSRSPTSDATTTSSTVPSPAPPSPKDEPDSAHTRQRSSELMTSDDVPLPSGVFTLLTDCYSPTCSRDQLCYSIACPRRLEQQARLNMKLQPGLKKQISRESLEDLVVSASYSYFTV